MQTADIDAIEAAHCERAEKSKVDNYCCGRNCGCCGSTRVRMHSGNHCHIGICLCKYPICEIPNLRRCLWVGCAYFRTPRVSPGSGSERRNWGDRLPYSQRMSVARLMARTRLGFPEGREFLSARQRLTPAASACAAAPCSADHRAVSPPAGRT